MSTIRVEIVSAEEEIWSGEGTMVFAPGTAGELGIAPRHTPLITQLKPGDVRVELESGEQQFFFISGGLLEVQPHLVTVLSDTALRADDLDEAQAQADVCLDLGGRPFFVYNVEMADKYIRDFDITIIKHFWRSFCDAAKMNLHIELKFGEDLHHCIEAVFKAVARALRMACDSDPRALDLIPVLVVQSRCTRPDT